MGVGLGIFLGFLGSILGRGIFLVSSIYHRIYHIY
jgi:hypothetical protein